MTKRFLQIIILLLALLLFGVFILESFSGLKPISCFIEAQTCLKVGYATSRLRTISEALDIYFIENKTYPPTQLLQDSIKEYIINYYKMEWWTYPKSILEVKSNAGAIKNSLIPKKESKKIFIDPFNKTDSKEFLYYTLNEKNDFIIWSIGPDRQDGLSEKIIKEGIELSVIIEGIYDPTNGVKSKGDIVFSSLFKQKR